MTARAGQAGFTLFEILVAVAVLAISFGGLYAGYASMVDIAGRVEHTAVMEESARLVMDQIDRDLESLAITTKATATDRDRYSVKVDEKTPDSLLQFTTRSSLSFRPVTEGVFTNRVTYALAQIQGSDLYRLTRRELAYATVAGPWPTSEMELCSNIKSFTIEMEEPKQAYSGLGKARYVFRIAMTLSFQGDERDYVWTVVSRAGSSL